MQNSADHKDSGTSNSGMPVELRILFIFLLSVITILVDHISLLVVIYLFALLIFGASKPSLRNTAMLLAISFAAIWGFVVTQSFFYPNQPRTVLLQVIAADVPILGYLTGGVSIYLEGIIHGTAQSLRFLIMVTIGLTMVWNTSPQQILKGLRNIGLPRGIAFMLSTALRFIPTITKETSMVISAMRIRGFPVQPSRPWNYVRALRKAMSPILFRNIRRAAMLADSIECKGFNLQEKRNEKSSRFRLKAPENILAIMGILLTASLLLIKALTFAAVHNIYYSENLGWLYAFSQNWL